MVATLYLLTCALAPGQASSSPDWPLAPHLLRGQEFVYSGSFTEESTGLRVQYNRSCRLETRLFVLNTTAREAEVAFFTVITPRAVRPGPGAQPVEPSSIRLELAKIDIRGRTIVTPLGDASQKRLPPVPLEGPNLLETGALVEVQSSRVAANRPWQVEEEGKPDLTWRVVGTEVVNGVTCLKLSGVQQSSDWAEPRADSTAWRRQETVWISPSLGIASRFERLIERREPARRDPTHRSTTTYTLDSQLVYPGRLAEDRQREILLVQNLSEKIKPFLREPEKCGRQPFEEVAAKIAHHLDEHPATPYRLAMQQVKKRVEAGLRGEAVAGQAEVESSLIPKIVLGKPAPDFVVTDLHSHASVRLRRVLGQPILMVFYNPNSTQAKDVLQFAQKLAEPQSPGVSVFCFAVTDDINRVLKQREELRLTVPVLSGQGLRLTYAVEATPKLVVLDGAGIVRGAYVGWGRETPSLVCDELDRWKRPAIQSDTHETRIEGRKPGD
jgi:peroxiredoxin